MAALMRVDMHPVIFLDHSDTRTTVLSNLINVGPLHQPNADVGGAVGCTPYTVGRLCRTEDSPLSDGLEELALPFGKNKVGRFERAPLLPPDIRTVGHFGGFTHALNAPRTQAASKSLKWTHCTGHALAISESQFSAHFNLDENRLAQKYSRLLCLLRNLSESHGNTDAGFRLYVPAHLG
jgi:hypothetical protein